VDEIQLAVRDQPRPREVTRTDNRRERPHAIGEVLRADLVLMEQISLGMEEPLVVEPDLDLVGPEVGDQVLDELEGFRGERLDFQVAPDA
jgi:hypothetical protein